MKNTVTLIEERTNESFQIEVQKEKGLKKNRNSHRNLLDKIEKHISVRGVSEKGRGRKISEDITDKIFSDLMKI